MNALEVHRLLADAEDGSHLLVPVPTRHQLEYLHFARSQRGLSVGVDVYNATNSSTVLS